MTIQTDNWIRGQCEKPTHVLRKATGSIEYASVPFTKFQQFALEDSEAFKETNIQPFAEVTPITEEELSNWRPMISPFVPSNIKTRDDKRIISYGLTSFGYDVRLANKFKIFTNVNSSLIDPLNMPDDCYVDFEGESCIIPPHGYMLGHTEEYFVVPKDVIITCVGKSTLARVGLIVNVTPIEPGFEGQVVIEISNATNLPVRVYANQGVSQFLFDQSDEPCSVSYADKKGKYQGQTGIQLAKV